MCLSIPKSSYVGGTTFDYDGQVYSINCGIDTNNLNKPLLSNCSPLEANTTGLSKSDCMTGSSFVNSCCYYSKTNTTTLNAPSGCYWLGTKYTGETTWAGMNLNCSAQFVTFSMALLVLFLSLLF
jgi:hypothetical protein